MSNGTFCAEGQEIQSVVHWMNPGEIPSSVIARFRFVEQAVIDEGAADRRALIITHVCPTHRRVSEMPGLRLRPAAAKGGRTRTRTPKIASDR